LMHVIAAKAVAFKEALSPEFKSYQHQVVLNARAMAEVFIKRGDDIGLGVVSGGTDNHLFLVDLRKANVTGKDAEAALGRAHLTVNKNSVPNDPKSPFVTSGLRLGSPASTTRGFKEKDMRDVAGWICDIVDVMSKAPSKEGAGDVEGAIAKVRGQVEQLCAKHPVYQVSKGAQKGVKAA
ncbi:MAG: serine hydroxymethyltransferase, partial [Nevskiaceae bacterium]